MSSSSKSSKGPLTPEKVSPEHRERRDPFGVSDEESEEQTTRYAQVEQLVTMLGELHKIGEISASWQIDHGSKFVRSLSEAIEEFQVTISQLSSQLSDQLTKEEALPNFATFKKDYDTLYEEFVELKDTVNRANEGGKRLKRHISDPPLDDSD